MWKKRFSTLIYGLLYPAFLGNMVYDLILSKRSLSEDKFTFPDFFTCLTVALFSAVDYMHLNADMNDNVPVKRRSVPYILVDSVMPFVQFGAFVSIKEEYYRIGGLLITIIPGLLLFYKWRNKPSRSFFKWYFGTSAIVGILLIYFNSPQINLYFFFFVIASFMTYTIYVTIIYPKMPLEFDKNFIDKETIDY